MTTGNDRFVCAVREFVRWARHGKDTGNAAAWSCFRLIGDLLGAISREPEFFGGCSPEPLDQYEPSPDELAGVFLRGRDLPLQYYGEVFNTLVVPPEEPCLGDLSDDIRDIYFDLVVGLRAYDDGRHREALDHWVFHFHIHWGEHATSALRALYWHIRSAVSDEQFEDA